MAAPGPSHRQRHRHRDWTDTGQGGEETGGGGHGGSPPWTFGGWVGSKSVSGWVRKEPLTSDRSAFCKGSRESKVNDRRQSWGAGGPQGGQAGSPARPVHSASGEAEPAWAYGPCRHC